MRLRSLILGLLVVGTTLAPLAATAATVRPAGKKATAGAHKSVLPWIADDLPRAMALAKARKTPIFVESWAPW